MIDEETFEAWRDHPVTQWVMDACQIAADDARNKWMNISWHGGKAEQQTLIELRSRSDTYLDLIHIKHADVAATHGEEAVAGRA